MTCVAHLIRPKDLKVLKEDNILKDNYLLCEEEVKMRNRKLKRRDEAYWTIVVIYR